jgi:hypothetical protein
MERRISAAREIWFDSIRVMKLPGGVEISDNK